MSFSPECSSKEVSLVDQLSSRMGYLHKLSLMYKRCNITQKFNLPLNVLLILKFKVKENFKINIRAVTVFQEIGGKYPK